MTGNEMQNSMHTLGVTVADMARRCGTTRPTVYSLLDRGAEALPEKWQAPVASVLDAARAELAERLASVQA